MPASTDIYGLVGRGVQPLQDPLNTLAKTLQIQEMQQLGQDRALKQDEYRRGVEQKNKLMQLLGGEYAGDEERASALLRGGFLKESQDYLKGRSDLRKTDADVKKTGVEMDAKRFEIASKKLDIAGQAMGFVKDNPSVESANAAIQNLVSNGIWDQTQAEQAMARVMADPSPESIRTLATVAYQSALSAKDQLPSFVQQNRGGTVATQRINPITGVVADVQSANVTESEAQRLEREQRAAQAAAALAEEQRRTNLGDKRAREKLDIDRGAAVADAGGPTQAALAKIYGKASPGYRLKPDGSEEPRPGGPADIKAGEMGAKAAAKRDAQISQAESVLGTIRDAKKLVGYTTAGAGGYLSGVAATPARDLQGKLETVKANLGFDRLQQMRDNSPTGGALGAVAVQELTALQSTVASLDQLQSPGQLRKALDKIDGHYTRWLDVMKRTGGGAGGADAGFDGKPAGAMSPEDTQARDWAKKNPNDPRAKQIMQRLGG